jgi:predicted GIY-YIG superfamily endonuclease
MTIGATLYILRCADGSYYGGLTRDGLEKRLGELSALSSRTKRAMVGPS